MDGTTNPNDKKPSPKNKIKQSPFDFLCDLHKGVVYCFGIKHPRKLECIGCHIDTIKESLEHGSPCEKHNNMEIWIAQIESDKSGCFGCFVEARERKATKSLQARIVLYEKALSTPAMERVLKILNAKAQGE